MIITKCFIYTDAPEILDVGVNRLIYQVHTDIAIPCGNSVVSDPLPSFSWKKCNSTSTGETSCSVRDEGVSLRGELLLSSVKYSDGGTYECTATNILGSDKTSLRISVLGEWEAASHLIIMHIRPEIIT